MGLQKDSLALLLTCGFLALGGSASCNSGNLQGSESVGPGAGAQEPQSTTVLSTTGNANDLSGDGNTTLSSPQGAQSATKAPCKRGVGAEASQTLALSPNDLSALCGGVSWWYNWGYSPGTSVSAVNAKCQMEYVPMVWTAPFDANAILAKLTPSTRYLLAFNEPNFAAQGNLTPEQAARYWPQLQKIADDHNLAIVSPALNYCGGAYNETDPFKWFDAFFAACPNCRVDYIAIHSYVCYDSALQSAYLKPFAQKYGKKLWLTEFSCGDGSADATKLSVQKEYMNAAVADLEANDDVFRYAWFLARTGANAQPIGLLAGDGTLSELGAYYLSLPRACDKN